jgi:hypothetical protein
MKSPPKSMPGRKNDKAYIGLIVRAESPEMVIEYKKYRKRLTFKEASQG